MQDEQKKMILKKTCESYVVSSAANCQQMSIIHRTQRLDWFTIVVKATSNLKRYKNKKFNHNFLE